MRIILLESIDRVGKAGEIVAVKDGYANNYLIPRKLAIVANKNNKLELDKISLTMRVEANDEGGLYGTITQKQISDLLKAEGHSILNENIVTGEIKSIGEFEITIKIY